MKKLMMVILLLILTSCGYNTLQEQDELIKSSWSDVLNQYQRRSDLIPNLVATVKGYAKHEKEALVDVTNARSKATSIQVSPDSINDADKLAQFEKAQSEMSGALSRLMVVVERYPDLKANENFKDLQAQLEGTENRITLARNRFIENIKNYNTTVRRFPTNITAKIFGMKIKPNFAVENEAKIKEAPKVEF